MKTLEQQIKAVKREIGKWERFYPGWVAAGRMTQAKADYEIDCMKSAYETLVDLYNKQHPQQLDAFGQESKSKAYKE